MKSTHQQQHTRLDTPKGIRLFDMGEREEIEDMCKGKNTIVSLKKGKQQKKLGGTDVSIPGPSRKERIMKLKEHHNES